MPLLEIKNLPGSGIHFLSLLSWLGSSPSAASPAPAAASSPDPLSLGNFYALETLLNQNAEGRRLSGLYWQHTAEVVAIVRTNATLRSQAMTSLSSFQPTLGTFLAGRGQESIITPAMIAQLNIAWTSLSAKGSPALKLAMETERARFNGFQTFANQSFNSWGSQLQLTVPEQPWFHLFNLARTYRKFRAQANALPGGLPSLWRSSSPDSDWQQVTNALIEPFDTGTLTLTDTNPPAVQQFYRLRAVPSP